LAPKVSNQLLKVSNQLLKVSNQLLKVSNQLFKVSNQLFKVSNLKFLCARLRSSFSAKNGQWLTSRPYKVKRLTCGGRLAGCGLRGRAKEMASLGKELSRPLKRQLSGIFVFLTNPVCLREASKRPSTAIAQRLGHIAKRTNAPGKLRCFQFCGCRDNPNPLFKRQGRQRSISYPLGVKCLTCDKRLAVCAGEPKLLEITPQRRSFFEASRRLQHRLF
jgi:hypothetical protein